MKTYKQRYQETYYQIKALEEANAILYRENAIRKTVIENGKLFDPVKYTELLNKFETAIKGLQEIKSLSFNIDKGENQDSVYRVVTEVLEQLKDK